MKDFSLMEVRIQIRAIILTSGETNTYKYSSNMTITFYYDLCHYNEVLIQNNAST